MVTFIRFLQEGCSLSKMMVSAPLQYRVNLPSGLHTGNHGGSRLVRTESRGLMHKLVSRIIFFSDCMSLNEQLGKDNVNLVIS